MRILLISDSTTSGAGKALKNIGLLLSDHLKLSVSFQTFNDLPFTLKLTSLLFSKVEVLLRNYFVNNNNYFSFSLHGVFNADKYLLCNSTLSTVIVGWCNKFFLNYNSLARLNRRVIIRLSDDWMLTGGCHFSKGCPNKSFKCNKCPLISLRFFQNREKSLENKLRLISHDHIYLVFPSQNNMKKFHQSYPDLAFKASYIPTSVDTHIFCPQSLSDLNGTQPQISTNKVILSFVASDPYNDIRKNLLFAVKCFKALKSRLPSTLSIELYVLGGDSQLIDNKFLFEGIKHFGYIDDPLVRSQILSQSRLHLTPSIDDNVPNTALEALACGCPLASHNVGGLSELTHHSLNGFLFESLDHVFWVNHLLYYIQNIDQLHPKFSQYSRDLAVNFYSKKAVSSAWHALLTV